MSPNERDTEPPAPDATAAPEREDPWSWRAYPDEAPPEDAESPVSEEPAAAAVPEELPAAAAAAEAEEAVGSPPAEPSEVAEAPATAEAPAARAEEPRAGGEAVGLSDWDERVRLLERVEPGEPAPAPPWWPPPPTPTLRPPQPAPGHWPPPSVGRGGPPALPAPEPLQPGPPQPAPPRSLSPRPAPPGGWVRPVGAEPPWGFQQAPAPARPPRSRRRGWIIVLAIVAALAVMAVQLVQLGVLRRPDSAAPRGAQLAAPNAPAPSGPGASASTLSPQAQVVRLLTSRSSALLRHDKAAFLATVDRRRGSFYRSQAALFDRMVTVPFASFSYSVSDPLRDVGSDQARQRYSPTVVSIFPVEASFGFRGQDASPFVAHYFYTFAVTASGWRIAGQ